jgi:hypothetical protein
VSITPEMEGSACLLSAACATSFIFLLPSAVVAQIGIGDQLAGPGQAGPRLVQHHARGFFDAGAHRATAVAILSYLYTPRAGRTLRERRGGGGPVWACTPPPCIPN